MQETNVAIDLQIEQNRTGIMMSCLQPTNKSLRDKEVEEVMKFLGITDERLGELLKDEAVYKKTIVEKVRELSKDHKDSGDEKLKVVCDYFNLTPAEVTPQYNNDHNDKEVVRKLQAKVDMAPMIKASNCKSVSPEFQLKVFKKKLEECKQEEEKKKILAENNFTQISPGAYAVNEGGKFHIYFKIPPASELDINKTADFLGVDREKFKNDLGKHMGAAYETMFPSINKKSESVSKAVQKEEAAKKEETAKEEKIITMTYSK